MRGHSKLHRRPRPLPAKGLRLPLRRLHPLPNLPPSPPLQRRHPLTRQSVGSGRDEVMAGASKAPRAKGRRHAKPSLRMRPDSLRMRRANAVRSAASTSRPSPSRATRLLPRRPSRRRHPHRPRRAALAMTSVMSAGNIASAPAMRVPHATSRRVKRRRPRHLHQSLRQNRHNQCRLRQSCSRMRHPSRPNPSHRRQPPRPRPRHLEIRSPASVTAGAMASADHRPTSNDSHRNRLNLQRRPPVSRPLQQNPAARLRHPRRPARPRTRAPALRADSSAVPLRSRR